MKKLLVAVMALTMVNAFADDHTGHSMVRMDGCFDNGRCDALDFYMTSDDEEDNELEARKIALNYAYGWDMWGVGLKYITQSMTRDGDVMDDDQDDNMNTIGLSLYWNKDGGWSDSCFVGLHYDMTTFEDSDETDNYGDESMNTIALEYGHRYSLGKAMMGVQINYVPSITYSMVTNTPNDEDGDDLKSSSLMLNFANFAAVF